MSMHKIGATVPPPGHDAREDISSSTETRQRSSIRKRRVLTAIFIAALLGLPIVIVAYPTGAPAGYTAAPASAVDSGSDCTSCHGGTAQTTGLSISGFGSGSTYTPGAVQHLTVTVPASTSRHGFEFTARSASSTGTSEGTLVSTDSTTQVLSGGIFIPHTNASSANSFNFDWTPPSSNVGNIIFFAAGVNGYSNVYKTNLALAPNGGGGAIPTIGVSPTSLSFAYQIGGTAPVAQALSVTSSGAALSFTATASGGTWLSASPASGTTPGGVSVSVNPSGLAAGTYKGSVAIAASGASNSPQTVAVSLMVTPASVPNLNVSPTSLSFSAQAGGAAPAAQSISVGSSGAALNFTAAASSGSWLSATPPSGTTPGTVSVSVNPSGLAAGTYSGSVAIAASGAGNSPRAVAVTLTVTTAPPPGGSGLTVSPTSLSFSSTVSGASPAAQTLNVQAPAPKGFRAFGSGTSGGVTWLSISPSGRLTTNQNITVSVTAAGLAVGTYTGAVSIRFSTGEDRSTTITVPVTLVVAPLTITPSSLSFSGTQGSSSPSSQTLSVTGPTAASFTVSTSVQNGSSNWLSISPSGTLTANQKLTVSVGLGGLAAGTYNGTVSIVSGGTTATVPVMFLVNPPSSGGGGTSTGYKVIGWNDLGMHCFDGADYSVFGVLPPYNTIHAHLIDPSGTLVKTPAGYIITYQAINDPLTNTLNTSSIGKTNFWQFAQLLGFPSLTPDVGLKGYAMPGVGNTPQGMNFSTTDNTWIAEGIPITPFADSSTGTYQRNYFPMMRLSVKNSSGVVVGTTDIVVPTSDEMTCAMCHSSASGYAATQPAAGWVNNSDSAKDVKLNILRKHDDRFKVLPVFQTAAQLVGYSTSGLEATVASKPVFCSNCHASNALSKPGVLGLPPLTTAMHTMHSGVIDPRTSESMDSGTTRDTCYSCHPGPKTQCARGIMANQKTSTGSNEIECQSCHGAMSNVAVASRKGWLDEPNCQSCHSGTATSNAGQVVYASVFSSGTTVRTVTDTTFATTPDTPAAGISLYRYSSGHGGLQCEACHGSTHAEYETSVVNDNVQSNNLQGHVGALAECTACHASNPSTTFGGPHGLHPIGSSWVSSHPSAARGNQATCQPCHGTDYRGTILSKTQADRTLAGHAFPRGTIISCYSCHNGPSGDD
jgi:hypothetical protein